MRIKICGLTRPADARAAVEAGADLLGFIFVPGTPRALAESAAGWLRELSGAATVGVFRNAPLADILRIRERLGLDWVQLHGDEPDSWLPALGHQVLRRLPVNGGVDWQRVSALAEHCLPLIDPGAGDGITCSWEQLRQRPPGLRFGLAGGLTPTNVAAAILTVKPELVDVSSGIELSPGIKDPARITAFVHNARAAGQQAGRLLPCASRLLP